MRFPLRRSPLFVPMVVAGLATGCMGRVEPGGGSEPPGTGSSGGGTGSSSGGSSSSSGGSTSSSSGGPSSSSSSSGGRSPGDPDCSILAVPDIARVCPDGTSVGGQYVLSNHQCVLEFLCPPPDGPCSQGVSCQPGSGCGTVPSGSGSGCATSCMCDGTGHYQCSDTCQPDSCSQGAPCTPGSGCGGSSGNNCTTSCNCGPKGFMECATVCVDPGPPPITNPCPGFAVPDICQICSNGTTECAHAVLVKGVCRVEICPGS